MFEKFSWPTNKHPTKPLDYLGLDYVVTRFSSSLDLKPSLSRTDTVLHSYIGPRLIVADRARQKCPTYITAYMNLSGVLSISVYTTPNSFQLP